MLITFLLEILLSMIILLYKDSIIHLLAIDDGMESSQLQGKDNFDLSDTE